MKIKSAFAIDPEAYNGSGEIEKLYEYGKRAVSNWNYGIEIGTTTVEIHEQTLGHKPYNSIATIDTGEPAVGPALVLAEIIANG